MCAYATETDQNRIRVVENLTKEQRQQQPRSATTVSTKQQWGAKFLGRGTFAMAILLLFI